MRTYEIWAEGYLITGGQSGAQLEGLEEGITFKDACNNLAKRKKEFRRDYDSSKLTIWGCRLFDNEADARKSYG